MKKIFAIALALVMVLSMASAFATWCRTDFDWSCATTVCDNGTGSVELIPYVKGNDCGKGNLFTVSKCAGAVNGDMIYFAIKLTVDANPNEEWWDVAKLEFSTKKGIDVNSLRAGGQVFTMLPNGVAGTAKEITTLIKNANSGDLKAGEYYLTLDTNWKLVKAADFEADKTTLFSAKVNEAAKAKVCVKLSSENKLANKVTTVIGDYTVKMDTDGLHFDKGNRAAIVKFDKDDKVKTIEIWDKDAAGNWNLTLTLVADNGSAFVASNGDLYGHACNEGAFLKGIVDTFKFNFGTCMTKDAIKKNFGWSAESVSCFQWNKDALAVVNAECQVAIPKTGDVSVVAYAVMALVAAAGAMGLKK